MEFKGTKGDWMPDIATQANRTLFYQAEILCEGVDVALAFGDTLEECEANANLISYASDLLTEHQTDLKHLLTWGEVLIRHGLKDSVLFQEYLDMIHSKRLVINKALK